MVAFNNSRFSVVVSLLVIIFSLSLPAYAQYSGGTGEPNDPYQIATAEDLMLLGETPDDYDKHFILTADIDLDPNLPGRKVFDRAVIAPDMNDVDDRFQGTWFTGVFDGNDHIISNLTIEGNSFLGLFGGFDEAKVSNLGLETVDVNGTGNYVSGLVGSNGYRIVSSVFSGGEVTNCYGTGRVRGCRLVGGLVGYNEGNITMSYSMGTVEGTSWYVGGLVGCNDYGNITMSYSTGTVTGNEGVGGLVGDNDGNITTSYSTGMVTGNEDVGGLVGYNECGNITTSYSSSAVKGNLCVGGLVGSNITVYVCWTPGTVALCYSTGTVTGNEWVGGLVGYNYGTITMSYSSGKVGRDVPIDEGYSIGGLVGYNDGTPYGYESITKSFWDVETSGRTNMCGMQVFDSIECDSSYGKTTAEMQDPNTFIIEGWDFICQPDGLHDIWAEPEGGGYPVLFWQVPPEFGLPDFAGGTGEPNNPYLISTAEELGSIGHNPRLMNSHFKLIDDIDLDPNLPGRKVFGEAVIASPEFWMNWFFVRDGFPFTGVFDGNGHKISNLIIEGEDFLGLFGILGDGAEVKNLGVVDVNITGSVATGSLVGFNYGNITASYSTGTVSVTDGSVGGLVARNYGNITASFSTVTVTGNEEVGGLVGDNNYGNIATSYSTGTVTGNEWVGGLVGDNHEGKITMSYSTGTVVTGNGWAGGLLGHTWRYNNNIGDILWTTKSFWDIETSGQSTSDGGTGLTTSQMQTASTFLDAGWDFVDEVENGTDDIWWIDEGQDYPRLWWELIPEN